MFWASLYSWLHGHRDEAKTPVQAVAGGIATSAVAYVVDYHVVPKRLTPGWEHRMAPRSLAATFARSSRQVLTSDAHASVSAEDCPVALS